MVAPPSDLRERTQRSGRLENGGTVVSHDGSHRRVRIALLTLFSTLVVLGGGVSSAAAASRYNVAPIYVQEYSNWCWAATTKTVVQAYKGTSTNQCQLVMWGKNMAYCPDVVGYFGSDVSSALAKSGMSSVGYTTGPLSFDDLRGEIDSGRLVMTRWGWDDGSGHMLVMRGYNTSDTSIQYVNPLYTAYQQATYAWILNGGSPHHAWTDSRYQILS